MGECEHDASATRPLQRNRRVAGAKSGDKYQEEWQRGKRNLIQRTDEGGGFKIVGGGVNVRSRQRGESEPRLSRRERTPV